VRILRDVTGRSTPCWFFGLEARLCAMFVAALRRALRVSGPRRWPHCADRLMQLSEKTRKPTLIPARLPPFSNRQFYEVK
jgi:hypothetical protein